MYKAVTRMDVNSIQVGVIMLVCITTSIAVFLMLRDNERERILTEKKLFKQIKQQDEDWDRYDRHMKPIREAQQHNDS